MATPLRAASAPLAFFSDIHGNLPALEAVLAELSRRGITDLHALGDHLLGGPAPLETWKRLTQVNARMTGGPSDRALAAISSSSLRAISPVEQAKIDAFARTQKDLGELVLKRLQRLPDRLRIPLIDGSEIVMVHGSPADASAEMSHDLADNDLLALVDGDPADIVVCGATHVPFDRIYDTLRIVNVGSVGQSPEGAIAHFTVIYPRVGGADVEQTWAEYEPATR